MSYLSVRFCKLNGNHQTGENMCLAIPGKLLEIYTEHELLMGRFDFSGAVKTACLAYVPEIQIGNYAIVHAGFAINIIDEEEARKRFEAWDELIEAANKLENNPDAE